MNLYISPCPNDTFIFDALIHKKILTDFDWNVHFLDIQELNNFAENNEADVIKTSFFAWTQLQEKYELLPSGAALGKGCGPLLVTKNIDKTLDVNSLIAIPGNKTTAHLLLHFFNPNFTNKIVMPFHEIMPAVAAGKVDAGVIIHESRFTYSTYGLQCIQDLGQFWEDKTSLAIPLGGILASKKIPELTRKKIALEIKESIEFAFNNPQSSKAFISQHAQEMNDEVTAQHIALYVNDFSIALGEKGNIAIQKLTEIAQSLVF